MGLSLQHTSEVYQVLNMSTGSITTKCHAVFDDQFTTINFALRTHRKYSSTTKLLICTMTGSILKNRKKIVATNRGRR
jgi:hypothetical protein